MESQMKLNPKYDCLWGLFDNQTRASLTDGEITYLNTLAKATPADAYSSVLEFATVKHNQKIANIHLEAAARSEQAAQKTEAYSKTISTLTKWLAIAAVIQAVATVASVFAIIFTQQCG